MSECDCNGKWIAIVAGVIPLLYFIRKYFQGNEFTKNVSANGKVVIITGANAGIGKETAMDLARRGAKVYMACRDTNRCEVTRQEIIEKTGNKNVINAKLDLASLESVRQFVKEFLTQETRLDILINNAGVIMQNRTLTSDGFETTIGVNYFGHFLLTNLLLDAIRSAAPSRIVNVSSLLHKSGTINENDIHLENGYSRDTAYSQSKLANILFTRELAKRLQGTKVTANSLNPGLVSTEIAKNLPLYYKLMLSIFYIFTKTTKAGAQTTITVALDPDLENVSGKYFSDCTITQESNLAQDDQLAEWLWKMSEKMVKLI